MKFQNRHAPENDEHLPANWLDGLSPWVFIGYVASFLGGLPGMFIGSVLVSAKRVLTDGRIAYVFNQRSRKHGKIILYLSSVVLILSILFFINWFLLEKILFGKR